LSVDNLGNALSIMTHVPAVMDALQTMKSPLSRENLRSVNALLGEIALLQETSQGLVALIKDPFPGGIFLLLVFPLDGRRGQQVSLRVVLGKECLEHSLILDRASADVLAFIVQAMKELS
jgi:hypothetical protein